MLQDIRYGLRLLRREPGLTGLVLLTLALGIGANAAIFTLLDATLLQPLAFHDPGRLVTLTDRYDRLGFADLNPTIPELLDVRDQSRAFERVAFLDHRDYQVTGGDEPTRVFTARVSASFFPVLGVQPALGRAFHDEDNQTGRDTSVILTDTFWRRSFAADPRVIGRTIAINETPYTIVGVLPPDFSFDYPGLGIMEPVGMYVPFGLDNDTTLRSGSSANARRMRAIARLQPGVDPQQAAAEVRTIAQRLADAYPQLYRRGGQPIGFSIDVTPLHHAIVGRSGALLLILFGAVGFVLLIACANTAQFLLARTLSRQQEVAVRAALGASRARLIQLFLVESLLIAIVGGALGLWLSSWLVQAIVSLMPTPSPLLRHVRVDTDALLFTMGLSIVTALLFGLLPAAYGSDVRLHRHLSTRGTSGGRSRSRHALVAIEVALSVVLLVTAVVLVRGLLRLEHAPRGFSPDAIVAMQLRLPYTQITGNRNPSAIYQRYLARVAEVPGVASAAIATGLPIRDMQTGFIVEGQTADTGTFARQIAPYHIVSPDYFRTLRIPLLQGRAFTDDDVRDRPRVAIVSRELARRFWPNGTAIGKRLTISQPHTIVGVVEDARMPGLQQTTPVPQIYVSSAQDFQMDTYLAVRTMPGIAPPIAAIKQAIWSVVPTQPIFNVRPMPEIVARSMASSRFNTLLIGGFALLALVMSAAGVYGVVSYLVSRRVREIALRMAMGAQRADVFWLVAGQTLGWTIAGLAFGLMGATALGRVVRRMLEDVGPMDIATLAIVSAVYVLVAMMAVYVPARRAVRMDPIAALRCE